MKAYRWLAMLLFGALALSPVAAARAQEAVTLTPFTNATFGITGVAPDGWAEAAPGVFQRRASAADLTSLIQQAAPGMTAAQLLAALLPQLGLQEAPERVGVYESAAFTWDLYRVEVDAPGVGAVVVDLALAEIDAAVYLVLLQAGPDEHDALHEAVFMPAVEALAPLRAEPAESVYQDPAGRFTVPIPTNWTAEAGDGFVTLSSPEGDLKVYLMAVEGEDYKAAARAAWAAIDPEFNLEPDDVIEAPGTGAQAGVDKVFTITYDYDDEDLVLAAGGWVYDGATYVEILRGAVATYQKRMYQVTIIDSGFRIAALEVADLSEVEPLPLTDDLLAELDAYIAEMMATLDVPGAAVAIVKDGDIVYAKGYGVRELGKDDPVTPETLMLIGSTTKSMTTLLMATLVDDGIMDWDTRVVDILPTFAVADPEITAKITMRNLVCACTGVPRRDAELIFNANDLTAEGIIESLADFEFFTDFGEAFQYSNQMVAAAGYITALAAGGEYGDLYGGYQALMQARVFDPIGMTSSTFSFDAVRANPNHATPHSLTWTGEYAPIPIEREEQFLTPVASAGVVWSNALDMAAYLITELNEGVAVDGRRVVSAENLAVTWEPQVPITADASYGLGWIVGDYHGLRVIEHGGNTLGFTSDLAFFPEIGLGISVLTNQSGSSLNQLVRFRLLELLYQREPEYDALVKIALDQQEQQLAELQRQVQDRVEPEAVAPYLGVFTNAALGEITLALEGETLTLDAGEFQMELLPRVNDDGEVTYFSVTTGLGGEFQFREDDQGEPIIVLGGGAYEYTFTKVK